jgi:subtilisin family serine protease
MKRMPLLFALLVFQACLIDDQRLAKNAPEIYNTANPKASEDSGLTTNDFKVLVGVIDDGIDYNHPYLSKHILWSKNSDGEIIGTGFDFVGDDQWPAPYLVTTAQLYDRASKSRKDTVDKLIRAQKIFQPTGDQFTRFTNPFRAIGQEQDRGIGHGTHVAGLITYDAPEIGLIPMRILPFNNPWAESRPDNHDFKLLVSAIKQSIALGARVINLSLGITLEKSNNKDYQRYVKNGDELRELLKEFPQTLFVAAAGNDGKWVDGSTRLTFPCGVTGVPNLLCVGSLDKTDEFSAFTNIPVFNIPVVYVLGQEVLSTMPTNHCPNISDYDLISLLPKEENDSQEQLNKRIEKLKRKIKKRCIDQRVDFKFLSGTSMATPLISRVAAKIIAANPDLSAAQVIDQIKLKAANGGPFLKLRVKKPSWYQDQGILKRVQLPKGFDSKRTGFQHFSRQANPFSQDYFEFVFP